MAYVSAEAFVRQLEDKYRNLTVLEPALCNHNYEGEIKANETVKIVHVPGTVTTFDYAGTAWNDSDWNAYSETKTDFTIDQAKGVRIRIPHTVSAVSLPGLMDSAADDAAYTLATAADTYIGTLHSSITTNVLGSNAAPVVIGFDESVGEMTPTQALADMYSKISESGGNVQNLNVAFPAWFGKALLKELKLRSTGFGDSVLRVGAGQGKLEIGQIEGFAGLYQSNNLDTDTSTDGNNSTVYKVMAGNPKQGITFARRITEQKFLEMQNDFADLMKALHVYGGLVVREKHMALGSFTKGKWPNGLSL